MHNKQNIPKQNNSNIFLTHQSKPKNRYPFQDIEPQLNATFQSISNQQIKTSLQLSASKLFNYNERDLSLSLKQKYKLKHISLVHQLIATARSKKSQIEDLLRKQQNNAELEDLDENEVIASLRKLKKVVRLMQIVCKIIIGKNQQNGIIDISIQQEISMKQMYQQTIDNYQHELNTKNCQINRLKKLVAMLSLPKDQYNEESNSSEDGNSQLRNSGSIGSSFIVRNSTSSKKIQYKINHIATQTEQQKQQISDKNKKNKQILKKNNSNQTKKLSNFIINQQYSIWNILDARNSYQQQPRQQTYQICPQPAMKVENSTMAELQTQQSLLKKLSSPPIPPTMETKTNFLKRYKSMVKITINSLTLCNNIFTKCKKSAATLKISKQIDEISNYFNSYYHNETGKYNEYNDNFCKEIKEKMGQIYDTLHTIYKTYINDKQALSFWNDSRVSY